MGMCGVALATAGFIIATHEFGVPYSQVLMHHGSLGVAVLALAYSQAEASLANVCQGIQGTNSSAILSGVETCPPENTAALSTALAQAAAEPATVAPVAEACGSAAAAGLNTTTYGECIAAAYTAGGVSAQAMSAALTKAAQTGGCNGVAQALAAAQAVAEAQGIGQAAAAAQAEAQAIQQQCSAPAPSPNAANAVAAPANLPKCFGILSGQCCNQNLSAGQQCGCTPSLAGLSTNKLCLYRVVSVNPTVVQTGSFESTRCQC